MTPRLVIFGLSNILSDLFDCALANGLEIGRVLRDLPEPAGERDCPAAERIAALSALGQTPVLEDLDAFSPSEGEVYILGPTTPTRAALAATLRARFGLTFAKLVHPTAYVSPLAVLEEGAFVGANSVVAPGAWLEPHVFINRGVTIGHDTRLGAFTRVQPGCNLGGLSRYGQGVTVGLGATVLERLVVGEGASIGAGAVVIRDVAPRVLVVGVPAKAIKSLDPDPPLGS